jgi:hypothetical protein
MLRIKGNATLLDYLRSDMLSRVPNHPAVELLLRSQQASVTTGEDSAHAGRSRVEKRTGRGEEDDSHEVEEILGHRHDNQVFKLPIIILETKAISY